MGGSPVAGLKWQATHVQPGFGVRSELDMHARINCAADSRRAGAARSGITTRASSCGADPDRPTADLRPTLRCETTLTWRCELRAAPSTWLRRARAFACLACASRGWPGSIPKASSDLRSGQGVWILMAVLGLRRGARSDELRRGSCKRIFFVHGSQILRNLCPLSVLKPHFVPLLFPKFLPHSSVLEPHFVPLLFPNSPEYSQMTTSVKAVTAVFVRSKRQDSARKPLASNATMAAT